MSNLDDKLREMVSQITTGGHYERLNPQAQQLVDTQVAKIKQCFRDEELGDLDSHIVSVGPTSPVMSGQEFYDRFQENMADKPYIGAINAHEHNLVDMVLGRAQQAAKRAAGLEDKDEN